MQCIVDYEIESDLSVVSDGIQLKLQDPKGQFQAFIKNIVRDDYSTPFLLSLRLIFESPTLMEAEDIAEDKLAECLNILAFVTGAGVKRHRIKQIIDCTPASGMRDCLIWADALAHEDPSPFLNKKITSSMERLLEFDPPPAVHRALRWYRYGIQAPIPEDQFQCFWFALEILAEHKKSPGKVADSCPKCRSPLYCESCKSHPTHRPYAKQAIRALIQEVETASDDDIFEVLDKLRNALMHGATLKEAETKLPQSGEDLVDRLGKILFKALVHQFSSELVGEKLYFGNPTTYIHRSRTGIAHLQTVVPKGKDGELDLDRFASPKVFMATDGPPQSGRPSIIVMTTEQHKQLTAISRKPGDHQEMCERVCKKVKVHDGKIVAMVLSTDMTAIREAFNRGETGSWQDLFREIMNASLSIDGSMSGTDS